MRQNIRKQIEKRTRPPNPERPLLPKDTQGRATVRRIAAEEEAYFGPLIGELVHATLLRKGPEDANALADLHKRLDEELPRFEAMLSGEYFASDLSLADFTVYAVRREANPRWVGVRRV